MTLLRYSSPYFSIKKSLNELKYNAVVFDDKLSLKRFTVGFVFMCKLFAQVFGQRFVHKPFISCCPANCQILHRPVYNPNRNCLA
jgi:hypothetical protein